MSKATRLRTPPSPSPSPEPRDEKEGVYTLVVWNYESYMIPSDYWPREGLNRDNVTMEMLFGWYKKGFRVNSLGTLITTIPSHLQLLGQVFLKFEDIIDEEQYQYSSSPYDYDKQ